jgi:CRP-like cAMP-binding protein
LTEVNVNACTTVGLLAKLEASKGLRLSNLPRVTAALHVIELRPRQAAFRENEPCRSLFVVRSGLLKQLYTGEDGAESIKSFAREGEAFACPIALAGGKTTFASVAIEPSIVEAIDWQVVERLGDEELDWQKAIRFAFQRLAEIKVRRERDLLMLTPEQLYRQFAAGAPDLASRIPQKDLAAFLGVTPVGLNRIIRRVGTHAAGRARSS